jgi:hypothetical protein
MLVIVLTRQKGGFGMSSVFGFGWWFFLLFGGKKEKGACASRISYYWIPDPRKILLRAQQVGNDYPFTAGKYCDE